MLKVIFFKGLLGNVYDEEGPGLLLSCLFNSRMKESRLILRFYLWIKEMQKILRL